MDEYLRELQAIVGGGGVLTARAELLPYECDGLPQHKSLPRAVVFPRTTQEVSAVLRTLHAHKIPFAPRGAGTGLSGGALALENSVIIELARMKRVLQLDIEDRTARVETGLVNVRLSKLVAPHGLYYAPDPSSQTACTIGGNIAENAGGIHCLKYGVTTDHVVSIEVVLSDGTIVELDDGREHGGYDLRGIFIGSEGTFGIATVATVKLLPTPPAVHTLLALFNDVNDASRAVSAIIAAGILPAALEMVDNATIRAVEASNFRIALPLETAAALLIELDGAAHEILAEAKRVEAICRENQAATVRHAQDETERKKLWAARKSAIGALGRLAPDLMLQDAVVPRSRLPEILAEVYRIGAKYELIVANVFHAGDGNLHPVLCFDSRKPQDVLHVKEAGREIVETCVRAGGSITGEHGVGYDKRDYLPLIFSDADINAMLRLRAAFDDSGLCNPGKIIPMPKTCGEGKPFNFGARISDFGKRTEANLSPQFVIASPQSGEPSASANGQGQGRSSRAKGESRDSAGLFFEIERIKSDATYRALLEPESAGEISMILRAAFESELKVGITSRLAVENIADDARRLWLSTGGLTRIIEHQPADLIATAQAGVTLAELNAELARHNQILPLDDESDATATLGSLVACGAHGTARHFVIGMKIVLADGTLIKAGGRVVKNVAGYDLCKLFAGSRGTLGFITEITFKLRPLQKQTTQAEFEEDKITSSAVALPQTVAPAVAELNRRIKNAFDPRGIFPALVLR